MDGLIILIQLIFAIENEQSTWFYWNIRHAWTKWKKHSRSITRLAKCIRFSQDMVINRNNPVHLRNVYYLESVSILTGNQATYIEQKCLVDRHAIIQSFFNRSFVVQSLIFAYVYFNPFLDFPIYFLISVEFSTYHI